MIELKGLSSDVMKNRSDQENYNREFQDLQMQMFDLANLTFNGVSLFATTKMGGGSATFDNLNQIATERNAVSVYVSADGSAGPKVSINKALLLSALTINSDANELRQDVAQPPIPILHIIMVQEVMVITLPLKVIVKPMVLIFGTFRWAFSNRQLKMLLRFEQTTEGRCPDLGLPRMMWRCRRPTL